MSIINMQELETDIELMLVDNLNYPKGLAKSTAKSNVDIVADAMYEAITDQIYNNLDEYEEES